MVFFITITPWKTVWKFKPVKGKPVVYTPNHSSYLDIPSLCLTAPWYFIFVGKSSLTQIPLFGYMFRTLYISVDRTNRKSRYDTLIQAANQIDAGRSIVLFPEGTIPTKNNPEMIEFKDGAFRLAIEKQIPVVPVTIPYNWIILPDRGKNSYITWHTMKIIYHEPISTQGMTLDDLDDLKNKTYEIMDLELKKNNPELKSRKKISNFEKAVFDKDEPLKTEQEL